MKNLTYVAMGNNVIIKNEITTKRTFHELTSKRNTCTCGYPNCTKKVKPNEGMRITTPSHPRGVTFCDFHAEVFDNLSISTYSTENHETVGKPTAKGLTVSCEIETVHNTVEGVASMVCDLGFYASHDGSLDTRGIEYKSRICNSLNSLTKTFGTIQALNEKGLLNTLDETCGAHIHTGFYNDPVDFRFLYPSIDKYMEVFGELYAYLDGMPNDKMHEYFGRGFTNYARTIRKDRNGHWYMPEHDGNGRLNRDGIQYLYHTTYRNGRTVPNFNRPYEMYEIHSCIFNLQHSYSLEFRLPKFVNAEQYRKCVLAMQEVVDILRKNNFKYSPDLVAIFKKYFPY